MGLKYQSAFTSDKGLNCTLEVEAKGYTGDVIDIVLTGTPITHTWQIDEPNPAIKGSEIVINILNYGSGITVLPITDFVSDEDDFFKVIFKVDGDTYFEGYLVQDDYSEILVDFPHEISLKATDNLGLLKDIPLGEAAITFGDSSGFTGLTIEQTAFNKVKITGMVTISPYFLITIDSGTALDGQYAVLTWQNLAGPFTEITVEGELNGTVVGTMLADITFTLPIDLTQRMLLSELLALCFKCTNLTLPIRVYGTIYPDGAANNRLFDNVMITPETFLSGDRWASCYDIMANIFGRLGFTLLQAEGFWNLVRWDELRLHGNEIPGKSYSADFTYLGMMSLSNLFVTGFEEDTFPITGITASIQRPLKFAQETFNYKNPANMIHNINFTDVGELIDITTSGTDTIYTYKMVGWEQGFEWTTGGNGYIGSSAERLIKVTVDIDGNEKERIGVIRGNSGFDDYACAQSNPVEVRPGDRIKYSFEVRTVENQPNVTRDIFRVNIITTASPTPRSVDNRYLDSSGRWVQLGAPNIMLIINFPAGDSDEWQSVSVDSEAIPVSGILNVKLSQCVTGNSSTKETWYRNMRFEVIRQVAGSTKITGHQHTSKQLLNIKNTEEKDIQVDSSPSNAIAGTLFLETFTGPVQDLVTTWNYDADTYDKLGHITTRDELFFRRTSRVKLEGTLINLMQDKLLSALSVFTYAQFTGSNFASGKLTINYKKDSANISLFEMYNDAEDDSDLKSIYAFKYIYENG